MKILSKAHLFVFCFIQVGIFPVFTSPAIAQAPEYSAKKCLIIIKSYARKLKNAQIDGDQETYSTLMAKGNRFFRRRPECADLLSRLVGSISSPTPTYTPTPFQQRESRELEAKLNRDLHITDMIIMCRFFQQSYDRATDSCVPR